MKEQKKLYCTISGNRPFPSLVALCINTEGGTHGPGGAPQLYGHTGLRGVTLSKRRMGPCRGKTIECPGWIESYSGSLLRDKPLCIDSSYITPLEAYPIANSTQRLQFSCAKPPLHKNILERSFDGDHRRRGSAASQSLAPRAAQAPSTNPPEYVVFVQTVVKTRSCRYWEPNQCYGPHSAYALQQLKFVCA